MNIKKENADYTKYPNFNMLVRNITYANNYWSDCLEILFVLVGRVETFMNGKKCVLKEGDIFVVPFFTMLSISSVDSNTILVLQVKKELLESTHNGNEQILRSGKIQNNKMEVCHLMAEIMLAFNKEIPGINIRLTALVMNIIYLLSNKSSEANSVIGENKTQRYFDRIRIILEYIDSHYNEDISLNNLQEITGLSKSYISKFFFHYMGMNFLDYVNSLRLRAAVHQLVTTDKLIIDIALDNGFQNQKSFFKCFKKKYNDTPGNYRKTFGLLEKQQQNKHTYKNNGISEDIELKNLFEYLDGKDISIPVINEEAQKIDITVSGKKINHKWKKLVNVAKAKDLMMAPIREQLSFMQKEVGFEYIRFRGIFDDEMMVYDLDDFESPIYNFAYPDQIMDYLMKIGIKPYIVLGFFPGKMARSKDTLFYKPVTIAPPRDIKQWNKLLLAFIEHCIERYGAENVETWVFDISNKPELEGLYWSGTWEEYLDLYENTYKTIKSLVIKAQVGGADFILFEEKESHFVESFCEFCSHKKCVPDFLSIQVYPQQTVSLSYNRDSFFRSEPQIKREDFAISEDSDAFKNILLHFAEKFGKQYKIYLTEFNADAWSRNLCHDTCYTTAFITKSILENMDEVESFAYWTLSDFMEEMPIGKGPFFGNFGLFTHNSIPKPGLQAFRLLTFLENIEIARGPGYYVTKGDGKIQIMLYNYCHFDQQFCNRITWAITTTERYQVFNSKKLEIELELENLKEGQHNITYQYVNRENGSVFPLQIRNILDKPVSFP